MPSPDDARVRKQRKAWRKHAFTPEMLANIRYRYEQTGESINSISRYAKVSQQTIRRYAEEGGWTRFAAPPRDIPQAAKLAAEAAQLAHTEPPAEALPPTPDPSPPFATQMGGGENAVAPPERIESPSGDAALAQALAAHLARLNAIAAGIDEQIAVVRSKQMLPQSPEEVRENARTLEDLTAGASHIHRLLNSMPQGARADEPARNADASDLDARRDALAHRIESLIAEWLDAENAAGAGRG